MDLDANELEIMSILWEHGPQKPAEIQEKLSHPVKNSALRWQLGELAERGQVVRSKKGKAFYYRAATPRKRAFQGLTRRLAGIFSGGSAVALIGQMIEAEELSDEDIRALTRIAKQGGPRKISSRKGEKT